jgi:hypothetical protein
LIVEWGSIDGGKEEGMEGGRGTGSDIYIVHMI